MACVTAKCNELPGTYRNIKGCQAGIGHAGLMLILVFAQGSLDTWGERLQMAVNGSLPGGMCDVDGIAKAIKSDGDTTDVAVGNGIDVLALASFGSDVKSSMEVMGTRFAEIPRQRDFVIHWRLNIKD